MTRAFNSSEILKIPKKIKLQVLKNNEFCSSHESYEIWELGGKVQHPFSKLI